MTQVVTFVVAVLVFATSQYLLRLVIEPIQEQRRVIGRVANYLLRNQAKITNAHPDSDLSSEAKELAASLWSATATVFAYDRAHRAKVFGLPSRSKVLEASRHLNSISYHVDPNNPEEGDAIECARAVRQVGRLLDVPTTYTSNA